MKKMNNLIKFIFMALFLCNETYARTNSDIKEDIVNSVEKAVDIYAKDGISGLIKEIELCYDGNSKRINFDCVYLDIASRHINQIVFDAMAEKGILLQKTAFFEDKSFFSRIAMIFKTENIDISKNSRYINSLIPIINKLVENHETDIIDNSALYLKNYH